MIISSCGANENSYESDKLSHGYFAYYLLTTLEASRGLISTIDLYKNLRQQVLDRVEQEMKAIRRPC